MTKIYQDLCLGLTGEFLKEIWLRLKEKIMDVCELAVQIITAFAGLIVAITAWIGLNTWRQKSNVEQVNHFLDQLLDEVNLFVQQMQPAISTYKIIQISIDSQVILPRDNEKYSIPSYQFEDFDENYKKYVKYIRNQGTKDSNNLFKKLAECNVSLARMQSLVAKGHIYSLPNYHNCVNAVKNIAWQYDKLQGVAGAISQNSVNFNQSEVKQIFEKVMEVKYENINTDLYVNHDLLIKFVQNIYKDTYGGINKK